MFSEAGDQDKEIKSSYQNMSEGKGEKAMKIRRRNRRIEEWQKFENNCLRAQVFIEESRQHSLERSHTLQERGERCLATSHRPRARSLGAGCDGRRGEDQRSLSLPLPDDRMAAAEEEQMNAWRGAGVVRRLTLRASSLTALPEEAEEDAMSLRSKRRSKSIDSSYNYELATVESRV